MEDVGTAVLITEFYPKIPASIDPAPVTRLTPHFHDITISNVHATGAKEAAVIVGLPESPILNLRLRNVVIDAAKGATIQNAQMKADNFTVHAASGENITLGQGVVQLAK